jgi:6,7-dimethyl-8-ribityllumazine synthase
MYIRGHEGRGIGLVNKIKAYNLQEQGFDTVDANLELGLPVEMRTYDDSLAVFHDLGLKSIRLFTNNPEKIEAMKSITHSVAALASVAKHESGRKYLDTKLKRMNHRTVLNTFQLPPLQPDQTKKLKIGIVYTIWNKFYVDALLQEAIHHLDASGAEYVKMSVPGASELTSGARRMLGKHSPDAVIVLGALIRGSSDAYEVTCSSVMNGLQSLNSKQDVPITIGLLMCQDEEQAHERSHGAKNPAKAWVESALHTASLFSEDEPGSKEL